MGKTKIYGPGIEHEYGSQPISLGGSGARDRVKAAENLGVVTGDAVNQPNGIGLLDQDGFVQQRHYPLELGDFTVPTLDGPTMVVAGEESLFYITNYDGKVVYTVAANNSTVVLDGDIIRLTPDISASNVTLTVNGKDVVLQVATRTPAKPTILFPIANQSVDLINPSMLGSSYVSGSTLEDQTGQEWQLSESSNFATILQSYQAANGVNWLLDPAPFNKTLYLRTRHASLSGNSQWSDIRRYVSPNPSVTKPTITLAQTPGSSSSIRITTSKFRMNVYRKAADITVDGSLTNGVIIYGTSTAVELDIKATQAKPVSILIEGSTKLYTSDTKERVVLGSSTHSTMTFTKSGDADNAISYALLSPALAHTESSYEIATDLAFNTIVAVVPSDTVNKIIRDIAGLTQGVRYYVRAKHRSTVGESAWSNVVAITTQSVVNKPTITSPANASTNIAVNFTISASAFSALPDTLTHTASDWEISENEDFTAIVQSLTGSTTNKTNWAPPNIQYGKRLYLRVRYKSGSVVSEWSSTVQITTSSYIEQPVISAPANNAVDVAISVTASSSPYAAYPNTLTHTSTDWQLSEVADFSTIAREVVASSTYKLSWLIDNLSYRKQYYIRARYRSGSIVSAWSPVITFTTKTSIQTPTITTPAAGIIDAETTLTLRSSAYVSTPSTVQHTASDWEISESNTFATLVASTTNDELNKTSWVVTDLDYGKTYYVRARHRAGTSTSEWSPVRSFTTKVSVAAPSVTAPINNETDVSVSTLLTLTDFAALPVTAVHSSTDWQIATDSGFTSIARENLASTANKTSWNVTLPEYGKVYYLRARYRSGNFVSPWSATIKFTSVITVAAPTIVAPADGQDAVPISTTVTSSSFIAQPSSVAHAASDWQISLYPDFSSIYRESLNTVAYKTAWPLTGLPKGTTLYIRVRHRSATKVSEWSPVIDIRTAVDLGAVSLASISDKIVYDASLVQEIVTDPKFNPTVIVGGVTSLSKNAYTYKFNPTLGFGDRYEEAATGNETTTFDIAFSPKGDRVAFAHEGSPFVSVVPWDAETGYGVKYSDPTILPTGSGMSVAFSNSGDALFVAHANSPYISAYRLLANGFGAKYSNPATLPPAVGYDVAVSPGGGAVAVSHPNNPCVSVYRWTDASGFGLKYNDPSITPTGYGNGVAFSPSGQAIAVIQNTSPFVHAWRWSDETGFGTKYGAPSSNVSGNTSSIAFSPTGNAVAISHINAPCVTVYRWNDDTGFGTAYSSATGVDALVGTGTDVAFSQNGDVLGVTVSTAPYSKIYHWSDDTGFGAGSDTFSDTRGIAACYCIAFSPSALGLINNLNASGLRIDGTYLDSDPVSVDPAASDWEFTPYNTAGVAQSPFVVASTQFDHAINRLSVQAIDFPTKTTRYSVRARTKYGANIGSYSPAVTFKMPVLSGDVLINSPANNQTGVTLKPTFVASIPTTTPNDIDKNEIIRYEWSVYKVSNLVTPVYVSEITKGTNFTMPIALDGLTEHQVSVRVVVVDPEGLTYRTKKIASQRFTTRAARILNLSIVHEGKTSWNLDADGPLIIDGIIGSDVVITPTTTFEAVVKMWGAGGGKARTPGPMLGGPGGYASGKVSMTSGLGHAVVVGSAGSRQDTGYTYGGGGYVLDDHDSGSGGGRTALHRGPTVDRATTLLVAGGGGGAGPENYQYTFGGAGGSINDGTSLVSGAPNPSRGGGGGTQTGVGSVGMGLFAGSSWNGALGRVVFRDLGGDQGSEFYPQSGGGGGGWYGGGTGQGTGGGGGSSYFNPTYVTEAQLLPGQVIVNYNATTGAFVSVTKHEPGAANDTYRGTAGQESTPGRIVII